MLQTQVEHRRYARQPTNLPAEIKTKIGDLPVTVIGRIVNQSVGGACFVAQRTLVDIGGVRVQMRRPHPKVFVGEHVNLSVEGKCFPVAIRWTAEGRVGLQKEIMS